MLSIEKGGSFSCHRSFSVIGVEGAEELFDWIYICRPVPASA